MRGELRTCPDCCSAEAGPPSLLEWAHGHAEMEARPASRQTATDEESTLVSSVRAIFGRRYQLGLLRWRLLNHLAMHADPERHDDSRGRRD